MSAKWLIIKRLASMATCLLMLLSTVVAQDIPTITVKPRKLFIDTVVIVKHDTVWMRRKDTAIISSNVSHNAYDKRVHHYRKRWEGLIPTHTKLQFAGNMGLLSIGTGWDYGKRNQWETDIFLGFIPKYNSKRHKLTLTVKQNYMPWSLDLGHRFSVEPLTCGLYANTVFGDEFWVSEPDRYPEGYYGFSSKVRFHVFLGQRLTYEIDPKRRFTAKAITFFYEISTCDIYVVSAFTNKYLKPRDYLSLSFGIKLQLL